jgi:hypothetical protein
VDADEHAAPLRGGGPAQPQICRDRRADIGGQREPFGTVSFAENRKLAATPFDVVQPEAGDLPGA